MRMRDNARMNSSQSEPISDKSQHPRIHILRWAALLIAAWVQIGKLDNYRTDRSIPNQPSPLTSVSPNGTDYFRTRHIQTANLRDTKPIATTRDLCSQPLAPHYTVIATLIAPLTIACQSRAAKQSASLLNTYCGQNSKTPRESTVDRINNTAMPTSAPQLNPGLELRYDPFGQSNMFAVKSTGRPFFADSNSARSPRSTLGILGV